MLELFPPATALAANDLRRMHLLNSLGRMVIPKGVTKWHLCTDSTAPCAQASWIPVIPENYTCLASFEVENNDGFVKVREI